MKVIPETENKYFATEDGKIIGPTGTILKPYLVNGYEKVSLQLGGKSVKRRVHRLVAQAYIPNPEGLSDVDHIDENKLNNHVDNLQWLTNKDNTTRSSKGKTNSCKKRPMYLDDMYFESKHAAATWICEQYDKNFGTVIRSFARCKKAYGHTITFAD